MEQQQQKLCEFTCLFNLPNPTDTDHLADSIQLWSEVPTISRTLSLKRYVFDLIQGSQYFYLCVCRLIGAFKYESFFVYLFAHWTQSKDNSINRLQLSITLRCHNMILSYWSWNGGITVREINDKCNNDHSVQNDSGTEQVGKREKRVIKH